MKMIWKWSRKWAENELKMATMNNPNIYSNFSSQLSRNQRFNLSLESIVPRDCHGLRVGVGVGMGEGWQLRTPWNPQPVARVDGFVEGSLSAFF